MGGPLTRTARRLAPLVAFATCVSAISIGAPAQAKRQRATPRVVVAVVDSGINPYHEFFNHGGPLYGDSKPSSVTPAVLRELGVDERHIISLTRTGDLKADVAKDKAKLSKIKRGELYWFEGTNVLGISFQDEEWLRPDGTASSHGIGTAAAVLNANPEAIVIAVEGINDDSEEWAFTNKSVDIVTTSYGPFTSVPTLNHLSSSYTGVVKNGKAHFGAAANDPTWSSLDETSGPWWTIGIAGFEEDGAGGRQLLSGNVPDFVGDFTQELPYCRDCEEGLRSVRGTSFATPRSAGTFSKIVLELRRRASHAGGIVKRGDNLPLIVAGDQNLTVWDLRRALEEAAYYPGTEDFSAGQDPTAVPVLDDAPWFQTGWGLLSPGYEVVREALAHFGVGPKPKRTKPSGACDFMTANMAARHAYWDQMAVLGESYGTSEDPYIYC